MAYLFDLNEYLKTEYEYVNEHYAQIVGYVLDTEFEECLKENNIDFYVEFYHYVPEEHGEKPGSGDWSDFVLFVNKQEDSTFLSLRYGKKIKYLGVVPY